MDSVEGREAFVELIERYNNYTAHAFHPYGVK